MSSESESRDQPLARIPGWTVFDDIVREMWGCSLATLLGAGNLGMAMLYTPQPVPASSVPGFDAAGLAFHGSVAVLLLVYGALY
jgi:hypothetical protein